MKFHYILFLCLYYTIDIETKSFIHNDIIKTDSSLFIRLPANLQEEKFDVTYFPQQIITVHDIPKRIHCPLAKKTSYLKYRLESSQPYQELELLIRKEPLDSIKSLVSHTPQKPFMNKVVRIYKKNVDHATWIPIATISEADALKVFAHATVHPDGTLHF